MTVAVDSAPPGSDVELLDCLLWSTSWLRVVPALSGVSGPDTVVSTAGDVTAVDSVTIITGMKVEFPSCFSDVALVGFSVGDVVEFAAISV